MLDFRTLADTNFENIVFSNGFWISGIGIEKTQHFIIYLRSLSFKSDDSCTLLYIRPSKMTTVAHFNLNLLFLQVFLNISIDLGGSSFRKPLHFTSGIEILGARRDPEAREHVPDRKEGRG